MGLTFFCKDTAKAVKHYAVFIGEHCDAIRERQRKTVVSNGNTGSDSIPMPRIKIAFCDSDKSDVDDTKIGWLIRCDVSYDNADNSGKLDTRVFTVLIECGSEFMFSVDWRRDTVFVRVAKNTDALRYIYALVATLPLSTRLSIDKTTRYVIEILERFFHHTLEEHEKQRMPPGTTATVMRDTKPLVTIASTLDRMKKQTPLAE